MIADLVSKSPDLRSSSTVKIRLPASQLGLVLGLAKLLGLQSVSNTEAYDKTHARSAGEGICKSFCIGNRPLALFGSLTWIVFISGFGTKFGTKFGTGRF